MSLAKLAAVLVLPLVPALALAAGAHEMLGCNGCHSIHKATSTSEGAFIFAVAPNKKATTSKGQPVSGVTALCLGCHESKDKGGNGDAGSISGHMSHPFGLTSVNPKIANVPPEGLRNGKFECTGCHDPHPSNPNYAYLRLDTKGGKAMDKFCAACHSTKADPGSVQAVAFFSSMDERAPKAAVAAPPAKK
jgi:predicted CXXCH cytochrome family protein